MRWLAGLALLVAAALLGARFERHSWIERLGALSDALSEQGCEGCDDGDLDLLDRLCAVQERFPGDLYEQPRVRRRRWAHR